jgi:hypothetical protein
MVRLRSRVNSVILNSFTQCQQNTSSTFDGWPLFSDDVVNRSQYFIVTDIIIEPCYSDRYDIQIFSVNKVLKRF